MRGIRRSGGIPHAVCDHPTPSERAAPRDQHRSRSPSPGTTGIAPQEGYGSPLPSCGAVAPWSTALRAHTKLSRKVPAHQNDGRLRLSVTTTQ